MKTIATVEADFDHGPLGTPSRLREELLGETVLRRTLKRALAAERIASVHLIVRAQHEALGREAAAGLNVRIETHTAPPVPWRPYVASARKWALDGWRGGIGGLTMFDESLHPWVLESLARREGADAVADVPAAAALLDPALLDAMIEHLEEHREEVRWVFTQSAPGLTTGIYQPAFLADLSKAVQPPGRIMAYRPSDAERDIVLQPCFYPSEAIVARAVGRCLADTGAGMRRIAAILHDCGESEGTGPDATTISGWLANHPLEAEALPVEVEIEATTDDSLAETTLRPRGHHLQRSGRMDMALFKKLIAELATRNDARVVLGGFGDPLMHPDWMSMVTCCREAGILAIAVRTPGIHLDDRAIEALLEAPVDVLNVLLDANSAETYRRVHGHDAYEEVCGRVQRLLDKQRESNRGQPLVVCELTKTRDTMDELEAFFDGWISRTGGATISGPSHYARQFPDRAVMSMAPATRRPCERIFSRCLVLSDGRVTACDQDFRGLYALGNLQTASLSELWNSPTMQALRRGHLDRAYDSMPLPLCAACDEWHRP